MLEPRRDLFKVLSTLATLGAPHWQTWFPPSLHVARKQTKGLEGRESEVFEQLYHRTLAFRNDNIQSHIVFKVLLLTGLFWLQEQYQSPLPYVFMERVIGRREDITIPAFLIGKLKLKDSVGCPRFSTNTSRCQICYPERSAKETGYISEL